MERVIGTIRTSRSDVISTAPALTNSIKRGDEMAKESLPKNLSIDNLEFGQLSTTRYCIDLTGQRFGRLVVLGFKCTDAKHSYWWCQCDCGAITLVRSNSLRRKTPSRSCGCLLRDILPTVRRTHGKSNTPIYFCWRNMLNRCYYANSDRYDSYGGRGIQVCDRWRESFENFLEDMGEPPTPEHTLERKNNDGNYEPSNCRWATKSEQAFNRRAKRSTRLIVFNGKTNSVGEWSKETGLDAGTIRSRLVRGWSVERALTTSAESVRSKG